MLSQDAIKTLAVKNQTTDLIIRREYVQHLFLSYFYTLPAGRYMFLKGGAALRIAYGSPRFCEYLDFSTSIQDSYVIKDALVDTLKEIEREGIKATVAESKEASGGYMAIMIFELHKSKVSIELNISYRKKEKHGDIMTIASDFIPPYIITTLVQKHLVAEKIQAALTRKKARDFYDIYFILHGKLLDSEQKEILPAVRAILQNSSIHFEAELKYLLPRSHSSIIRNFKKTLLQELERHL